MSERISNLGNMVFRRGALLCAIDEQPRAKPALTKAVSSSRSTVDRGVEDLVQAGCIERHGNEYHVTLLGELACEWYRKFRDNVAALDQSREILERLSDSARIDTTFLQGAEVRTPNPVAPEQVLQPSIEALKGAKRLRGLAPVGIMLYVDLINEYARENGLCVEIIVKKGSVKPLISLDRPRLTKLIEDGSLDILVTEEDFQYALWLIGSGKNTTAGITIYDEGGVSGMVMNETLEAVRWAEREYERYRRDAAEFATERILAD